MFGERKKIGVLRKEKFSKSLKSVKIKSFSEALSDRTEKVKFHIMLKLIALNWPQCHCASLPWQSSGLVCSAAQTHHEKTSTCKSPFDNKKKKSIFKLPSRRIVNTFCRSKRNRFFISAFRIENKKTKEKSSWVSAACCKDNKIATCQKKKKKAH